MAIIKGKVTKGPAPQDWKPPTNRPKLTPEESEGRAVLRAKWASLKEEFLERAITGKDIHWPSLAAKYGFRPQTARQKASTQKWYAEIEIRRKEREDILEAKLTERTTMALDKLNEDFATNEATIRKRHAAMARGLQVRAIQRLKEIDLADLSARDALMMLKMGIEEERFALGMPQVYSGPKDTGKPSEFTPIVEQIGGHQRIQQVGMMLLKALQESDLGTPEGENAYDDEVSDAAAAGLKNPQVVSDVKPK